MLQLSSHTIQPHQHAPLCHAMQGTPNNVVRVARKTDIISICLCFILTWQTLCAKGPLVTKFWNLPEPWVLVEQEVVVQAEKRSQVEELVMKQSAGQPVHA